MIIEYVRQIGSGYRKYRYMGLFLQKISLDLFSQTHKLIVEVEVEPHGLIGGKLYIPEKQKEE